MNQRMKGLMEGKSEYVKGQAIRSKGRKGKASVMGSNPLWTVLEPI